MINIAYRPEEDNKKYDDNSIFNMDNLLKKSDNDEIIIFSPSAEDTEPKKKRRGRPPKKDTSGMVHAEPSDRELSVLESNTPYIKSYDSNMSQLNDTIASIDLMAGQIQRDIQMVRSSRTLKKKYDYICELSATEAGLVGNRISAIKELNNIITNSHKLEMSRSKELKGLDNKDDDKAIMDMYNAYVNTPMGSIPGMGLGTNYNSMMANSPSMSAIPINNSMQIDNSDSGYEDFKNNPTPEMTAIAMEKNPNIKTVVVYNQETGERYFDVIDTTTGASIPNVARPGDFIMNDMDIDINAGCARNINMNISYPLVINGNRKMDEY